MFFLQYECFKPFEDKVAYSSVSDCQGVFTTVMLFFWGSDGDHEFFGVLLVQNERWAQMTADSSVEGHFCKVVQFHHHTDEQWRDTFRGVFWGSSDLSRETNVLKLLKTANTTPQSSLNKPALPLLPPRWSVVNWAFRLAWTNHRKVMSCFHWAIYEDETCRKNFALLPWYLVRIFSWHFFWWIIQKAFFFFKAIWI